MPPAGSLRGIDVATARGANAELIQQVPRTKKWSGWCFLCVSCCLWCFFLRVLICFNMFFLNGFMYVVVSS